MYVYLDYLLQMVTRETVSRWTQIPRPRLTGYIKGIRKIPTRDIRKIRNTYRRATYNMMRLEGVPVKTARKYRDASLGKIHAIISELHETARKIADEYDTDFTAVMNSIARSKKTADEIIELYR